MALPKEPLSRTDARRLIRQILEEGEVRFTGHFYEQAEERGLDEEDAKNVLRGGWVDEEEERNGTWRYRVMTHTICVVVGFRSETALSVITIWRL